MYLVSEEFLKAIESSTRSYRFSGTITTKSGVVHAFGSEDILKGSGYIKRQCCGDTEIELGSVYAAEMGITLMSDIDRYTLFDAEVRLFFTLKTSAGEETIPLGVFEISEANRNHRTLEIKAYDYMLRFDKTLSLSSSSGTAYQFIKAACDACNVEMAQTPAEIAGLPNGELTLGIYSDNDIETYRDLLFYTAQVLGCFCQIDRQGRLILKSFDNAASLTVKQKHRYDSSYSDFVTKYTALSSTNILSQTVEYAAMETDDGLTLNIGANPFMQLGLKSVREKMLRSILASLQKINYLPFNSTTIGNPAIDPGDVIKFTGGHADESKLSCITGIEYRINGKMSLKCVGKNPRLSLAKNKNEKSISGLLNSVERGKTVIYSFVNVSPFVIGQSLSKVMDIDFTATEETSAAFQCEMLLEVTADEGTEGLPEMTVVYKINDEAIDNFMPTKTCLAGKHIVTLFYPISKVIENSANTFSMYLKAANGQLTIGEAQIRATISGQGLAAGIGEWNGRISVNENIGRVTITQSNVLVDSFDESTNPEIIAAEKSSLLQGIANISIASFDFSIDGFSERVWTAEILRTFVLNSVRGRPQYNAFVTINSSESFVLRKRYAESSGALSVDSGFAESILLSFPYLESVQEVELTAGSSDYRKVWRLDVTNTSAAYSEGIQTQNGCFELCGRSEESIQSIPLEINEGNLQGLLINTEGFDGVKGVEMTI